MGPFTLGDVTRNSLKGLPCLQREVALLRDVARIPKEVGEEAVVEEASPVEVDVESTGASSRASGTVSICRPSSEASLTVSSKLKRRCSSSTVGTLGNCFDLKRGPQ